jgi:hypothetical protein
MRKVYRFLGLQQGRKKRAEISLCPAVGHSCRRSGRSSALPYPPHERGYSIMFSYSCSGRFFVVKF